MENDEIDRGILVNFGSYLGKIKDFHFLNLKYAYIRVKEKGEHFKYMIFLIKCVSKCKKLRRNC